MEGKAWSWEKKINSAISGGSVSNFESKESKYRDQQLSVMNASTCIV